MVTGIYRGVVRDGRIELLHPEPRLAEGTEVLVTPTAGTRNSAELLAAMESAPHVPTQWVDELERLIAAGRRPPTRTDPFSEEDGKGAN